MTDQMYKPMPRSPITTLYQGVDSTQTNITVVDASKLPDAPNKATIGGEDDSETVMYTGKSGNDLTGCTRGFDPSGSAKAWDSGTPVARVFTSQDLEVVQDKVSGIEGDIGEANGIATLDSGGDVPASQLGNTGIDDHIENNDDPHKYEDVSTHQDYAGVKYKLVVDEGVAYMEVTES